MAKQLYFIAIELPEPLNTEMQDWQHKLSLKYHSKHALKTPPHITLQMPMRIELEFETRLLEHFTSLKRKETSGLIYLNNIGSFEKSTIFIDVKPVGIVMKLYQLVRQMIHSVEFIDNKVLANHFHPHLTLMTRDLRQAQFELAMSELKNIVFQRQILVDKIHLYKHDGEFWKSLKIIELN